MPSMKTSVLPVGELNLIVNWMLHNWAAKCVATLGASPGPGALGHSSAVRKKPGFRGDRETEAGGFETQERGNTAENPWVQTWDGDVPDWSYVGAEIPEVALLIQADAVEQSLTRSTLIRFDIARQEVEWASRRAVLHFEGQMALERSYRGWSIIEASKTIMMTEKIQALAKVFLALLPKGKRTGRQKISTRRKYRLPVGSFVEFSGKPAWRGARGRPPLSEAQWLARYRKRLERRRAKNRTDRRTNRGNVKAPAVRYGRPPQEIVLGD